MVSRFPGDDSELVAPPHISSRDLRQSKPSPCQAAFRVARLAGAADVGTVRVDDASRRAADLAIKRRAAVAVAAHPGLLRVDEFCRNLIKRRIVFQREARPVPRIAAARAARLTRRARHAFSVRASASSCSVALPQPSWNPIASCALQSSLVQCRTVAV